MKNSLPKFFILFLPIILSVSSCSDFRKAVGEEKVVPDEFSIATTPSLVVPPGYKIDPGKIKNVNKNNIVSNALNEKLNIITSNNQSESKNFIELFGSKNIPKDIRKIVDEETTGIALSSRTGIDILFGNIPSAGIVIDTKKESLRVRKKKNQEATPAFDKNTGKTILIK
jgi:hypothetical protein